MSIRDKMILLVEDNPRDEALMLRTLKRQSILNTVVVARDGEEALDHLLGLSGEMQQGGPALPELVLLDLKLPKISGLEVLRRIRSTERTRLLPVVILTSSLEEQDLLEGYRLGTNSYIRKPVDFIEFTEAVRQIVLYWLLLNHAPSASN
jgi:two-component system response regulator